MARRGVARSEAARGLGRGESDGSRAEAPAKTAATRTEERVTFYRTLTAPTSDLPQVGKPTIEERLVPRDEPAAHAASAVSAAGDEATEASPGAPERAAAAPDRPAPPAPAVAPAPPPKVSEPARPPRAVRVARAPPARPAPAQLTAAAPPVELEAWTVQVSAFRSRALAEELRSRLAARGFEAHVFPSITEDGRPRYRVRVGAYASRTDAERAAGELRSERGLNPLVTPRTTR
jgi:cell division septation protein DedD